MGRITTRNVPKNVKRSSKKLMKGFDRAAAHRCGPGSDDLFRRVRHARQRAAADHAGHEHRRVLLRQSGAEDDGAGQDAQRPGHDVLERIDHRHLVGDDLEDREHQQDGDDPGVLQDRERRVVQVEGAEQPVSRDEAHEGQRQEGAQPGETGEPRSRSGQSG